MILTPEQQAEFEERGILLIPGFYDLKQDIEPIWREIHQIIGLIAAKYELSDLQEPFDGENFDSGYQALIAQDRSIGGEIYDAVKQTPSFQRLCAHPKNTELFCKLRNSRSCGLAAAGSGIRINNPREEHFRAQWHQDYSSQLRSPDGIVFWSPLIPVSAAHGPVEFCIGTHKQGIATVITDKSTAYLYKIKDEPGLENYPQEAPLSSPGDLLLIDFLNIHRSGSNQSDRSLWTMQFRYFNFENPEGQRIKWSGAFASGVNFHDIYPQHSEVME